jgi:hypothetical protein
MRHSIEDCLFKAKWVIKGHIELFRMSCFSLGKITYLPIDVLLFSQIIVYDDIGRK